jgi:hypothetical protein
MILHASARILRAAMVLIVMCAAAASAQAKPSVAALATAREILELKGGLKIFDSVVSGVIEQHKNLLLQSNPMIQRDLDQVAAKLHAQLAPRRIELQNEVIALYAQAFTEQELKAALAFYKSPLGKKLIQQEPKVLDASMKHASEWADKLAKEVVQKMRVEMRKKGHNM